MKMKLLLALLPLAFALTVTTNVHPFRAEAHFMCKLCERTVEMVQHKEFGNIAELEKFTGFKKFLGTGASKLIALMKKGQDASAACSYLKMCDNSLEEEAKNYPQMVNNQKIIDAINGDPSTTWTAGHHEKFDGMTHAQLRVMLGTIVDPEWKDTLPPRNEPVLKAPSSFDPLTKWPNCANVIGHIRDQSACGSCWAFGSTEAFEDRYCIANNSTEPAGSESSLMSVEDTFSCCKGFACGMSQGCNGGQPTAVWRWISRDGVVSGGDYDDTGKTDTCSPYKFPPCAHHVPPTAKYKKCPKAEYRTPACKRTCINTGYAKSFAADKRKAKRAYSLGSVNEIMSDVMQYGSATAAFTVYADFPTYKSGVYSHKSGSALGGHAIKVVGWGEENGTPYWKIANSWNEEWGDQGYFKILKGSNECGIEDDVSAGQV